MIRYVAQTRRHSCGPVVFANALKWAGAKFSYTRNKRLVSKLVNYHKGEGTYACDLTNAFKKYCNRYFDYKIRYRPSIKEIDTHLSGGGAIVVFHRWKNTDANHVCLIHSMYHYGSRKFYMVINLYNKEISIPRDLLKFCFLRRCKEDMFWFISRLQS